MGHEPQRMSISYQKKLQLHPYLKIGDWFLFKYFIVIIIYGFKLEPYQLPIYIPPRLFAIEYRRQRLINYQLHFVSKKKIVYISLPGEVSCFFIKSRPAVDYINKLLASYHLKRDIS